MHSSIPLGLFGEKRPGDAIVGFAVGRNKPGAVHHIGATALLACSLLAVISIIVFVVIDVIDVVAFFFGAGWTS
ncbi:hypothetical protein ACLE2W_00540 [Pseudomonas shahriarae]|uniref:hypothetical protein n=1 Tax=Pseudomonas shahriarae TaxID=2745512 RepID=UPI0020768107|nr:hypothetical protein [Pseudomonas shahriarae]MCM8558619.1 hypothetical protein [Pseudomonas shahriarae]